MGRLSATHSAVQEEIIQQGGLGFSSTSSATPWYKNQKVLFHNFCYLQRDPNMLPGPSSGLRAMKLKWYLLGGPERLLAAKRLLM